MAPSYLDLGELKSALKVEDRESDDQLIRAIGAASRFIERYCNDLFAPDDVATPRLFQPGDGRRLTVGSFASPVGVTVRVDHTDDGTWDDLSAEQWVPEKLMHRNLPDSPYDTIAAASPLRWPDGRDTRGGRYRVRGLVEVTARWGWPETPDDVVEACQVLAAGMWQARTAKGGFAEAVRGLNPSAAQTPEYALQAQNILDRLRRPSPAGP